MGSEVEVGINIKGEKDQSEKDLWHFFQAGSDAHFFIFFFRILSLDFFMHFLEEVRTRT